MIGAQLRRAPGGPITAETAVGAGVRNDPSLLVCLPARGDPSIRTGSSVEVRPPTFEIGRGGHVANSNLGNGILRPETFDRTRRQ
jgi:hypothetical protein